MVSGGSASLLAVGLLLLAMAFGAILTLIGVELRNARRRSKRSRRMETPSQTHGAEEMKLRHDLVAQLMSLYSGVHSADALSDFLNKELERRLKPWRVRIPSNGPGEIFDID